MPVDHKEIAFETAIEESLLTHGGYLKGDPEAFDRELALDRGELFAFVRDSQPKSWAKLEGLLGAQTESTVLDNLLGALAARGSLDVLRHGFKCFGKQLALAYFAPAHGMNPTTQALYAANRLTVTRQLKYSLANENSVDLVLALNGLPVVTAELKNPMTGQTVALRHAAVQERPRPREPIFRFKARTLVHFAVDPDEVYMTTRLAGKATQLPALQQRRRYGAGNPPNPAGYRTAYLWEQVWRGTASSTSSVASCTWRPRRRRWAARRSCSETHDLPALPPARLRAQDWKPMPAPRAPATTTWSSTPPAAARATRSPGSPIGWRACTMPQDREGLRQRRRGHRPPRARPAAPGHDLPVRAQAGRRAEDRRELDASSPRRWEPALPIIITTLQKFPFVTREDRPSCPKRPLRA